MTRREVVLLVALVGLASLALHAGRLAERSVPPPAHDDELGALRAQLDSLEAYSSTSRVVIDSLTAAVDSVKRVPLDTVYLEAQRDTVMVRDTVALRILDERDSIWGAQVAWRDTVIERQASVITEQRGLIFTLQARDSAWAVSDSLHLVDKAVLRAALVEAEQPDWKERGVWSLAGAGLCALLCQ